MKLSKLELPLRATLLYLLFGGLCILLSDQILARLLHQNPQQSVYQTIEDWFFIVVSSVFLYILLRRDSAGRRPADKTTQLENARWQEIVNGIADEVWICNNELLAEHSRDIILFMRRDDGRLLEVNAAASRTYGYSREELLRLTIRDLRAPDTLGLTAEQMAQADAGGVLFETVHRRKDGSTFPVEVSSQGATIGGVRTLISIVRDLTDRKQAEDEILSLSKFPAENPYPILRVQNDGRVTYANAASQELLEIWGCEINGYLPEELKNLIRVIVDHASNKTLDIACNDKVYSITLVPIAEGGYVNLYGSDITARKRAEEHVQKLNQELSHHATELEFANEELGIIGEKLHVANEDLQKEIAEHKRAEEALRISEERFRFALANSPVIVANLDPQLRYTWVYNPLTGFNPEELVGKTFGLTTDPATTVKIRKLLEELLTYGTPTQWENAIQISEGEKFFQSHAEPVRDSQGKIIGVTLVSIDITERKRVEENVQRSEAMLRAVLDQMPSGVTVRDAQTGSLLLSNARSKEIMGTLVGSANQFVEYRGFHPDGRPYQAEEWPLSRSMVRGEVVQTEEVSYQRNDGTHITLSINSAPVRDPQGQIVMAVSVFDDITERKRAEEQLHRLLEELKVSNAELEQFAYVASHDLQEPLRMVSSYVQLLARRYQGKLDSDADEFIAFAVDGAKRMQNLINDLLAYSRVGTRGHTPVSSSCEGALKEALANLQFAIEESGATITHEPLPDVKGDPTQLVQLFQNLLSNAIKFRGSEPPRIRVEVHQESAEWVFRVCDNGIGLDPKFAERIFVIFQRLHQRDAYPGTGIGLAICKRIVQRHGGRIWVESQPGEGATFYFTLPIKENT